MLLIALTKTFCYFAPFIILIFIACNPMCNSINCWHAQLYMWHEGSYRKMTTIHTLLNSRFFGKHWNAWRDCIRVDMIQLLTKNTCFRYENSFTKISPILLKEWNLNTGKTRELFMVNVIRWSLPQIWKSTKESLASLQTGSSMPKHFL